MPRAPTTWAQMISQAEALARQGKPHHIEIQGASYEGYTVWVNAMIASAGGRILSEDGQRVVLGPPAAKGISLIGQPGPRGPAAAAVVRPAKLHLFNHGNGAHLTR